MTVQQTLVEPRLVHGLAGSAAERKAKARELLDLVGLNESYLDRRPLQLSGGQRQRVSIARALALGPDVIICDEAVSSLDVSVQAKILRVLRYVQSRYGVSYLFVSHDLGVVRSLAHRVAVMYLGRIVEIGDTADVFSAPAHPYTKALLSAEPVPHFVARKGERIILHGDVPSPINPPSGCRFRTRCWKATSLCAEQDPVLLPRRAKGHQAACHFPEDGDS